MLREKCRGRTWPLKLVFRSLVSLVALGMAELLLGGDSPCPAPSAGADESVPFQLAWFSADISPPLGKMVDIGFRQATQHIEHPALAKGVLIQRNDQRYVLVALDYSGLCNASYEELRAAVAEAAETDSSRVAVQAVHQHTTVCLDADAARLLFHEDPARLATTLDFDQQIRRRVAQAVAESRARLHGVSHLGLSQARVDRVASSRRIPAPDGRIVARLSSTRDPELQALPEGLIDPWLKAVTFYDGDKPLVQLHYYATHPQSFYGDHRCTWDVPGMARERLEEETGVFQIYFTGCGGNVAMGKYNDGTLEAREQLAERLYQAMREAAMSPERQPAGAPAWRTHRIAFPLRSEPEFQPESCRETVLDLQRPFAARLKRAMCLAWSERVAAGETVELSCLAIGSLRILHLPGEPFVEYQLAAQRLFPEGFVAVAGYGECAMWYIGTDAMYAESGGYEQSWSFVGPCEERFLEGIERLLTGRSTPPRIPRAIPAPDRSNPDSLPFPSSRRP
jgi:hypothetical protein